MTSSIPMLNFKITTNKAEFPFDARYPATMALVEFKIKLELKVGVYRQDMKLELRDKQSKFLGEIFGDDKTLEGLGICNDCIVHVIDLSGNSPAFKVGDSEKYVMSDEKYNSRKSSVRKWKQEIGVGSPSTPTSVPENLQVGKHCNVLAPDTPKRRATIKYIGNVHFKPGIWVGVCFDEATGKNDGSIENQRYFECEENHGGFILPKNIELLDEANAVNGQSQ